jgi:hypothetical protein
MTTKTILTVSFPLPEIKKSKSDYLDLVDFALGKPIARIQSQIQFVNQTE